MAPSDAERGGGGQGQLLLLPFSKGGIRGQEMLSSKNTF